MHIRHVRTHDEFVACVELQAATWGDGFSEIVPATILKITQRLGGVTAGAFAADGTLLGFVFGVTGVEHGEIVHWSDMLAVRADAQNHRIGRHLKEFQRESLRVSGVTRMYWTYDPLVARNAHFNLNRLGARVAEYVPNMYGADTGSAMHSGLGTDRFIVVWPIDGVPARANGAGANGAGANASDLPVLNAGTAEGLEPDLSRFSTSLPPAVRVEIPSDISAVQAGSSELAARWRATTRRAIQWALASGYTVHHFAHDPAAARGHYVLTRAD